MKTDKWKYYNHAVISDTAPHEEADTESMRDEKVFWAKWHNAIFARWTSDFDCGVETEWWYIIKDTPIDLESMDSKVRKHIRQSLKKLRVEKIDPKKYAVALSKVHADACSRYENYTGQISPEDFTDDNDGCVDYWGAFCLETGEMAGYMKCHRYEDYVNTDVSKFSPFHLNLRPSDALHYTVINYYINDGGYRYISSGSRNISHVTNVQDYKIKTFGFRKAYCKLHIEYNPKVRTLVKLMYPFRGILKKLDFIGIVHNVNAVMKMEEILRRKK